MDAKTNSEISDQLAQARDLVRDARLLEDALPLKHEGDEILFAINSLLRDCAMRSPILH